jgi:glutamate N-acetyltransferase/amino-acid N-acetyltransferase
VSVTAPKGFRAAGTTAGLKPSGAPDLALVVNDGPLDAAAGVFTANRVKAAPVLWSAQVLAGRRVQAVVLNSGGANACTGPDGFADTTARRRPSPTRSAPAPPASPVCSTGPDRRAPADGPAAARRRAGRRGAQRDGGRRPPRPSAPPTRSPRRRRSADGWSVGRHGQGAAMLSPGPRHHARRRGHRRRRRRRSLDEVLRGRHRPLLRPGRHRRLHEHQRHGAAARAAARAGVAPSGRAAVGRAAPSATTWRQQMVRDAEGASKDIAVEVVGPPPSTTPSRPRAVGRSNLLKCALHGHDPNWGRVLAAVGTTPAAFEPDELDVAINGVQVCRGRRAGRPARARRPVRPRRPHRRRPARRAARGTLWTSDLTAEYVHENSAYST